MLKNKRIGFIGAGSMAEALIKGILNSNLLASENLYISDPKIKRVEELKEKYDLKIAKDNHELVKKVDYIILAVKPKIVAKVLSKVGREITDGHQLFSIAAGITIASIEKHLQDNIAVIRLMPNTPALIGEGATAYSLGHYADDKDAQVVEKIFNAVGVVLQVEEDLMDAVTALSGSGPAYIYLIIEALTDAGVNVGLPREIASKLTLETILGATKTVLEGDKHPAKLKDMVTSPGGTTITALKKLEEGGVRAALYQAVEAATKKSKDLQREE